ncbi:ImmA/IrrE family metallo-endopeptidase [Paenibacillus woosongensis]|uniref:IrrE N-terminal-like domain-containing protein n=1 Tax=Paenibacillus woosongensis TaxID=307580 RepID=A0ABQ4MPN9_9BACL|nr:ImmA/IrrE family metallo-endopeptidase [Paenibacillus woosongensis]GIP57929.1 hypothetical protein J15TS10_17430 [Paenibacillus woosongensis]
MSLYVANPMSRKKIRDITNFIRKVLQLENEPYFPVLHFLELGMPLIDNKFNYEIKTVEEMGACYGITYPEENRIDLREDVYERAVKDVPRDRFTIAHEIAHYLLHTPKTVAFARANGSEKLPAYLDPEWQANAFAGELLAPPHLIKEMSLSEIEASCGVSRMVAEIQLKITRGE